MEDTASPTKRRRLDRVAAACDLCKSRKVKCDGSLPCTYCKRKGRETLCHFSGPKLRATWTDTANNTPTDTTAGPDAERRQHQEYATGHIGSSLSPTASRDDLHEDTAVPLEARLLRDAQGKVIFIGDCAPLSFLQTVRHLIAREVDADGFPVPASRDSILEIARPPSMDAGSRALPGVQLNQVGTLVQDYFIATSGLVDLFERDLLVKNIQSWVHLASAGVDEVKSAVYYLVTAIAIQENDETKSEAWFNHSKDVLLKNLCNSMNIAMVQGFTLVAIYMLRAFQPNGAYLYFSLAARTAYAIGLHRAEVNASFGAASHAMRNRIWKSLRVVDMFISNLLGRPPSTSDIDCTVKYSTTPDITSNKHHLLDASVQMFMIIKQVVLEVYSRKRISLRIASYVSHQLKGWATSWLRPFSEITTKQAFTADQDLVVGACSALCTYYYGIMLLTRPFLIYDLYEYFGTSTRAPGTRAENQEKRKYADAALDAAVAFVDTLRTVIDADQMPYRIPLVVSWLFPTALVLAVGVLGRSGLSFEPNCRSAIWCLDYFAKVDPHARQYSLIVHALLQTTTEHVRKREQHLRSQRNQASSQLFGLLLSDGEQGVEESSASVPEVASRMNTVVPEADADASATNTDWTFYDADFFALPWVSENDLGLQEFLQPGRQTLDGSLADIPLFPMYDYQMSGVSGNGPTGSL